MFWVREGQHMAEGKTRPPALPPEVVQAVSQVRYRGTAKCVPALLPSSPPRGSRASISPTPPAKVSGRVSSSTRSRFSVSTTSSQASPFSSAGGDFGAADRRTSRKEVRRRSPLADPQLQAMAVEKPLIRACRLMLRWFCSTHSYDLIVENVLQNGC
jgi:hypothetical protein